MFTLCSQTVLVWYGTVWYGKTDVCKERFIAPYRTVPVSASTLGAAGLMQYTSVRYVKIFAVNTSRADAVSLQVVRMRICTFDPYTYMPAYLRVPIHASAEKSHDTHYGTVDGRRNAAVNRDME